MNGSTLFTAGLFLVLLIVAGWALIVYNGLVAARQECHRAWANIDVILKQRHDELPRLVDVCRGYMAYERGTLEAVVAARDALGRAQSVPAVSQASETVSGALRQLFAVAERYPDLKANESFLRLQGRITQLEDWIADRRELYNAAATDWNTRLAQIPEHFVARAAKMRRRDLWRAQAKDRAVPSLGFA